MDDTLMRPLVHLASWAAFLQAIGCAGPSRVAVAALPGGPVRLNHPPSSREERALPLVVWSEHTSGSEPWAVHVLRVDLHARGLEVSTVVADDPDGSGPAEAALTDPLVLARRGGALAAVNANAFAGLPGPDGKPDSRWREGLAVNIAGLVVEQGMSRSIADGHSAVDVCFGVREKGPPYIGSDCARPSFRAAVNGWSFRLVEHGRPMPQPGGDRHPRTAVGLDPSGRWLYLVVVDGRQPGYSVGMTPRELADLMLRVGADRAVNLDGGGSSIMLVTRGDTALEIINRPSGGDPRPVPVLLVVRRAQPEESAGRPACDQLHHGYPIGPCSARREQ